MASEVEYFDMFIGHFYFVIVFCMIGLISCYLAFQRRYASFIYMSVLPAFMCVHHVPAQCPQKSEKGIRSPEAGMRTAM